MKLGKFNVVSQGLALPLGSFEECRVADNGDFVFTKEEQRIEIKDGVDLTEFLGVKYILDIDNKRKSSRLNPNEKYNRMAQRNQKLFKTKPFRFLMRRKWGKKLLFMFFGKKKDADYKFPTHFEHIKKTDETRIENVNFLLEDKNILYMAHEKLDGTSATYILERKGKKYEFYVLSRNVRQMDVNQKCFHNDNVYWEMAIKYNIEEKMKNYLNAFECDYVCIQGEIVGNVQGNPYKLKDNDLYIFNFIDSDGIQHGSDLTKSIVDVYFGIKWVPLIYRNIILPDTMEEMKEMASGRSVLNQNVLREGLVYRGCNNNNLISDRKSTRLNSSHIQKVRMPSSACKQKSAT